MANSGKGVTEESGESRVRSAAMVPATRMSIADRLLGESELFLEFQERLSRTAPIDRPVLLVGERGTGKELAAARLHYLSGRWGGPFIAVNCAALSPSVLESELFGHEAGSFTGAARRRAGRFEAADGGTLFLDEIGRIPMEVQEKILRTVEYQRFERMGSSEAIEVNVRIVAATNVDLRELAASGRFKRDLLDRLAFEVLFLPPLRRRTGDLELLANHFAARMAHELGRRDVPAFSPSACAALGNYDWPGNVRELKNVVERAVARTESDRIERIDFDPFRPPFELRLEPAAGDGGRGGGDGGRGVGDGGRGAGGEGRGVRDEGRGGASGVGARTSLPEAVREVEHRMLTEALEAAQFNQRKAAEALGLTYHQFRGLYRKHRDSLGRE